MIKNKKAVLGEVIITFIATIIILTVLVLFAMVSAAFKTANNDISGVKINHPGAESDVEKYMGSFNNTAALRNLLSGYDDGKTFLGEIRRLDGENINEVMSEVGKFKDSGSTVQIEKGNIKFYCQAECKIGTAEFLPGKFLEFYDSPFSVKITIAQPDGVKKS